MEATNERLVGFMVDGEFITDLARQWFWVEKKGYDKSEELLLSCLICDQLSDVELKSIAREILEGKKKLVGINNFTLEDDTDYLTRPLDTNTLTVERDALKDRIRELEEQLEKSRKDVENLHDTVHKIYAEVRENYTPNEVVEEKYEKPLRKIADRLAEKYDPIIIMRKKLAEGNFVDEMTFQKLFGKADEDLKKKFLDFCDSFNIYPGRSRHGGWSWVCFYDKETDEQLDTDDFINKGIAIVEEKPEKIEEKCNEEDEVIDDCTPWGWLSPTGEFDEGDFGDHEQVAYDIIERKGWDDEWSNWERGTCRLGRDFLTRVKGYALLHNPMGLSYTIVSREKPLTKAQKEFLYDYFIKAGDVSRANELYKED